MLRYLCRRGAPTHFVWIAAHIGDAGNEWADIEANLGAQSEELFWDLDDWTLSPSHFIPQLPPRFCSCMLPPGRLQWIRTPSSSSDRGRLSGSATSRTRVARTSHFERITAERSWDGFCPTPRSLSWWFGIFFRLVASASLLPQWCLVTTGAHGRPSASSATRLWTPLPTVLCRALNFMEHSRRCTAK